MAVVSYSWWKRDLAGDPAVLDRKLKLGTTIFNIVGVAPPEFFGTVVGQAPDIWVPYVHDEIGSTWLGRLQRQFYSSAST